MPVIVFSTTETGTSAVLPPTVTVTAVSFVVKGFVEYDNSLEPPVMYSMVYISHMDINSCFVNVW